MAVASQLVQIQLGPPVRQPKPAWPKAKPGPIDTDEPRRVAAAVASLGLKHAVVTSVNRDDDNLGGARIFAETIRQIRELSPECRVEVLIPDFQGLDDALKID